MRWLIVTVLLWLTALLGGDARPTAQGSDVRNGEFRTWHSNGQLAEVRRYVNGREDGRQQSWTAGGVMYLIDFIVGTIVKSRALIALKSSWVPSPRTPRLTHERFLQPSSENI